MASAHLEQRQDGPGAFADLIRITEKRLSNRVLSHLCAAALVVGLPCSLNAAPVQRAGSLLQPIPFHSAWHRPVQAGLFDLVDGPRPDWITGLVEFLSSVPPECSSVSKQNTQQKCQQRDRGVLESFKERHPVAFNLLVAGLTLLAGFWIGGGFERGRA